MNDRNTALLPNGFVDLLPPEAGCEADAITGLLSTFLGFGYHRVKPPLVEFEESLFAPGPGAALMQETFRVMDPISHRMMGIRSDITAQIARIASSRLKNDERPLRLTYANDALRTKSSQKRMERQFCQVGCEIVGPEDDEADVEICVVALAGLAALDIQQITLDLSLPRLVNQVFDELHTPDDQRDDIREALSDRDVDRLKAYGDQIVSIFEPLLKASGSAEKALDALSNAELPADARRGVERLHFVYDGVRKAVEDLDLENVVITIDPLEFQGFEYHNGVAFSLFSSNAHGELGRGGRYTIGQNGHQESATGFTLYMDTVRSAMPKPPVKDVVFVSARESWGVIRSLQEEGWIVARGTGHNVVPAECTHEYKDGRVQKRS